jgi:hypothetical protein
MGLDFFGSVTRDEYWEDCHGKETVISHLYFQATYFTLKNMSVAMEMEQLILFWCLITYDVKNIKCP